MIRKLSPAEKMMCISVGFTMSLLAFRIVYSGTLIYIFFAWNLFLATIPLLFSRKLADHQKLTFRSFFLVFGWLLFLPNSPYIVTDIIHFRERWPVPKWYDLLLVISAAWNGLCLGFISFLQVEQFLSKFLNRIKVRSIVFICMFLCGYGIYIGRFLRFNSWDIVSAPGELASETIQHFFNPFEHFRVWEFTFLFSIMLTIIYFTLKNLPLSNKGPKVNY